MKHGAEEKAEKLKAEVKRKRKRKRKAEKLKS